MGTLKVLHCNPRRHGVQMSFCVRYPDRSTAVVAVGLNDGVADTVMDGVGVDADSGAVDPQATRAMAITARAPARSTRASDQEVLPLVTP